MPVWTITRFDGKPMSGFVVGLGGTAKAKRTFPTAKAAERGWKMIENRDPSGFANAEYSLTEKRSLADHLELDTECPALVKAVKAAPMDDTAQRVLADRLHELDIPYSRAYREAHQIALNSMNPCFWPKADVEKLLKGTGGADRVRRFLTVANEGRKTRIIQMSQALDICVFARKYGWHMAVGAGSRRAGGSSTVFYAAYADGKMRIAVGVVPSSNGSAQALTSLGLMPLEDAARRKEWVNRDEVAVWSTGVGIHNVVRFC